MDLLRRAREEVYTSAVDKGVLRPMTKDKGEVVAVRDGQGSTELVDQVQKFGLQSKQAAQVLAKHPHPTFGTMHVQYAFGGVHLQLPDAATTSI